MNEDRIFLVVEQDRHCDDRYSVHRTEAAANKRAEEIKSDYGEKHEPYKWTERSIGLTQREFSADDEDGPWIQIITLWLGPP